MLGFSALHRGGRFDPALEWEQHLAGESPGSIVDPRAMKKEKSVEGWGRWFQGREKAKTHIETGVPGARTVDG